MYKTYNTTDMFLDPVLVIKYPESSDNSSLMDLFNRSKTYVHKTLSDGFWTCKIDDSVIRIRSPGEDSVCFDNIEDFIKELEERCSYQEMFKRAERLFKERRS